MAKRFKFAAFILIFLWLCISASLDLYAKPQLIKTEEEFAKARREMVETQIKMRGVKDEKVLKAMLKVPRHKFCLEEYQRLDIFPNAYSDCPLPIGEGQTISQPYIVAFMTECLQLEGKERVLEIGTGSGYQAAILAEIVKEVYTIEILPKLAKRAEKTLKDLGYKNIKVKIGDGYLGWKEYAPFDAIIVTCAPDHIPKPLAQQLKEGGRMIIPVEVSKGLFGPEQYLYLVEKERGKLRQKAVLPVRFVPMVREEEKKKPK